MATSQTTRRQRCSCCAPSSPRCTKAEACSLARSPKGRTLRGLHRGALYEAFIALDSACLDCQGYSARPCRVQGKVLPFALKSQLYSILQDRTLVDRQLDELRSVSAFLSAGRKGSIDPVSLWDDGRGKAGQQFRAVSSSLSGYRGLLIYLLQPLPVYLLLQVVQPGWCWRAPGWAGAAFVSWHPSARGSRTETGAAVLTVTFSQHQPPKQQAAFN